MRSWKLLLPLLASTLCFAAQLDRITGPIDSSQMVVLTGNVHGLAQPRFDLGRTDGSRVLYGVTLAFRPSATQQADLNNLLAQQQDPSSPNYHKWLTPAQFADRFGMTQNDINRVQAWLELQGFVVTSVANSRNQVSFDGTVAQVELVFHTEIHNYAEEGEVHFANATNPSVPAALAGLVLAVGNLHNFSPKPRAKFRTRPSIGAEPHFTDPVGDHFLAPGDFATIYDLPAGFDGTGQTIAVIGQSTVSATDLANFRSAAGLAAKAPQYVLYPSTSTATRCSGDESESDLDLEWSGGVARNADIIFVYAGLAPGDTCAARSNSVWNALFDAVDTNIAPVISTSYGACEAANKEPFADQVQGWAQQANAQGQTIMASSGDSGAADCDPDNIAKATQGLAVDVPAAIPEVTGTGGTEFFGDAPGTVSGGNAGATTYWKGTTGGTDTLSSALMYIPEMGWNDTTENGALSASGGGASMYFAKPTWQTGAGFPTTAGRDVPDVALNASADHDPYIICTEDGPNGTIISSCTNGFVNASGEIYLAGGTSCAAPTFSAIVALLNESLGSSGLGNINPTLYSLAASTRASTPPTFHDVTPGNNIVPCTSGTTGCPATKPFQYGFNAGVGYDQVTGLGSVDASQLFTAWAASRTASSITITPSAANVTIGTSVSFAVAVTPATGVGTVSFSTLNNGTTTVLGTVALNVPYPSTKTGTATFTTKALPGGSNSVTATYEGDTADNSSQASTAVTVTVPFTMSASTLNPTSVAAGQTATSTITITPASGFTGSVSFTNSSNSPNFTPGSCTAGLPAGALCNFSQGSVPLNGSTPSTVTLTITTAADMALPAGSQAITVTGTSGSTAIKTTVSLTVTATNQSFTLASTNGVTFPVTVGGAATVNLTVASTNGFINTSSNTTALPLTYSCTGLPSEASCNFSPSQGEAVSQTTLTLSIPTTAPTAQMRVPLGRGSRIFYALLFPGLFGIVFAAGFRTRGLRLLSLIVVLGFSTLWLGSCGGSGGGGTMTPTNPGTPTGSYKVTISATTKGAVPLTNSNAPFTITLNVGQ